MRLFEERARRRRRGELVPLRGQSVVPDAFVFNTFIELPDGSALKFPESVPPIRVSMEAHDRWRSAALAYVEDAHRRHPEWTFVEWFRRHPIGAWYSYISVVAP